MRQPLILTGLLLTCLLSCLTQAYPNPSSADYLCEIGINYYQAGRYDEALHEFTKALMVQPDNQTAKIYISRIFKDDIASFPEPVPSEPQPAPAVVPAPAIVPAPAPVATAPVQVMPVVSSDRAEAIDQALSVQQAVPATPVEAAPPQTYAQPPIQTAQEPSPYVRDAMIENTLQHLSPVQYASASAAAPMTEKSYSPPSATPAELTTPVKVTGEAQIRMGFSSDEMLWKRANWDLNERNFRFFSESAFDQRENTYDSRIYDRLRINFGSKKDEGFSFHTNFTIDPWSFTGKSDKVTLTSAFGDTADVQLKYWGNTGYTVNQTVFTNSFGNSFFLPELKVTNGKTNSADLLGAFVPRDTLHIPELKIDRQFQPVREFILQYQQSGIQLKLFPIAYENQAVTFDDPLRLSNNHIWWEDSPWLHAWKNGHLNSGIPAPDFTKGYWDNSLSFFTKDSEGQRLTALRGFSFDYAPQETTHLTASIAAPKDLWQDFSDADNFLSATRITHAWLDNFSTGASVTTRTGYNTDDSGGLDASNYVLAADAAYEVVDGIKTAVEVAHSQSAYDITNSQYKTEANGYAYLATVSGRFPFQSIMNTEYGYDGIKPGQGESFFTKFRFLASRMDHGFDEPLSSYVVTRDDAFWGRHLHFRKPFEHYYQGEGQLLGWDDIKNSAVGNGIDIGRDTLELRVESSLWDDKVDNFFDTRRVHDTNGKFIEQATRDEVTARVTDKLTAKLLGLRDELPNTKGGIDPFIFNTRTREYYTNDSIPDGVDPSVTTGSMGAEYSFFDWLAVNGIWEYTNDVTLGYDTFPRAISNFEIRSSITQQYDNLYRDVQDFLSNQGLFPAPPYPYYNIFKTGLRFDPMPNLNIYLDFTRNAYEKAGQVDDNMNHVGFEVAFSPNKKISAFFRYTYSRWQDIDTLLQGSTKMFGHHNAFFELIYRRTVNDDFTFQYGEASRDPFMGGVLDIGWDPYGGSLRTIDTQHIYRLYYRRKF